MSAPSYYAVLWRSPPDLKTREVHAFGTRSERDAFVLAGPPGGPGWRLAVSGAEAASIRRSLRQPVERLAAA